MAFTVISRSDEQVIIDITNAILSQYNQDIIDDTTRFRQRWYDFWNIRPAEEMQAVLDKMALQSAHDFQLGDTNALSAVFAKALRELQRVKNENPGAFADARLEKTAIVADDGTVTGATALQPTGEPYKEFDYPGWYWTVDPGTGRFLVTEPVQWGGTPDQQKAMYVAAQAQVSAAQTAATNADTVVAEIQTYAGADETVDGLISTAQAAATEAHTAVTAATTATELVDLAGATVAAQQAQTAYQNANSCLQQVKASYPDGPPESSSSSSLSNSSTSSSSSASSSSSKSQ